MRARMLCLSISIAAAAAAGCSGKAPPPQQPLASGTPAGGATPATGAAGAPAAAQLPAGWRPLVANEPIPTPASSKETLLLAAEPGGKVLLKRPGGGPPLEIPEGVIAPDGTEPGTLSGGYEYDVADRAEVVEDGGTGAHTAQLVTRAEESNDFPHHDVWFVPTVATRVKLADGSTDIDADWSDPQRRAAVVMLDGTMSLVDVRTGASQEVGTDAGSPSFAPDGTLYFRTMDGGAWKWTGTKAQRIGRGKKGTPGSGDLNEGREPPEYPDPVIFDKNGKPAFK